MDALRMCRTYKGLSGLRQLQKDQAALGVSQTKCGWRWKPSNGVLPLTSQGGFGSSAGPFEGGTNQQDSVVDGTRWYFDLEKAEEDLSKEIISKLKTCAQLAYLPSTDAGMFGFCRTTNAIIPIERDVRGAVKPRFNKPGMTCDPSQIITAKEVSKCPVQKEGFEGVGAAGSTSNALHAVQTRMSEGFLSENCTGTPLTRDCVIQAARFAGCEDSGALITALKGGDATGKNGYDSVLKSRPSFQAYQSLTNPSLSKATLSDGSATLQMAIDNFMHLTDNTRAQKEKTRLSAIDLCLKAGTFDTYDFCQEVVSTTTIDGVYLPCLKRKWKEFGGTEKGGAWSALEKTWRGRTFGEFEKYLGGLQTRVTSTDAFTQTAAMRELIGIDVTETSKWRLPRSSAYSRGVELMATTVPQRDGEPIVVLGQLLFFGSDGETVMHVTQPSEQKRQSGGLRSQHVMYCMITDIRPVEQKRLQFTGAFTDGFYMSMNRMPFEPIGAQNDQTGIWNNSSAVRFATTPCYTIQKDSDEKPNILVAKWYGMTNGKFAFAYNDCAAAAQPTVNPNQKVTFFMDCDFRGRSIALGPGVYPFSRLMSLGFPNDALSSLRVPQGYRVQLFQDDIGSRSIFVTGDERCLINRGFNDMTSALIITTEAPPNPVVSAGVGGGEKLPRRATQIVVGNRVDPWWAENAFLVQEPSAPWLQIEVCARPDGTGAERKNLQDRRYVYCNIDITIGAVAVNSVGGLAPGKKEFSKFVSSSKWSTRSMFAYSGFRTLTLLVRPTTALSPNEEVHIFSHTNFRDQEIKLTMKAATAASGSTHQLQLDVKGGRSMRRAAAIQVGEWNLIVLQYIQEQASSSANALVNTKTFKPVQDISLHSFTLSSLASGSAIDTAWKALVRERNTATLGTLFPVVGEGVMNGNGAGYLVMGRIDPSYRGVTRSMDGFTGDIAWLHGFRSAMESKDMVEAEVRQTWKTSWYRR